MSTFSRIGIALSRVWHHSVSRRNSCSAVRSASDEEVTEAIAAAAAVETGVLTDNGVDDLGVDRVVSLVGEGAVDIAAVVTFGVHLDWSAVPVRWLSFEATLLVLLPVVLLTAVGGAREVRRTDSLLVIARACCA